MASTEQHLTELFRQLSAADQLTLLAFGEFLAGRSGGGAVVPVTEAVVIPDPEVIERPPAESVVAALKRLSKTYPMLDKTKTLAATSDLVATHIMKGADPVEAIDQLEGIFRTLFETLKAGGHE
jgi:hypothetical protein